MMDFAIRTAIFLPLCAVGALLHALWRQTHPWRPSPFIDWFYDRAERKISGMADLSTVERTERIARLQEERNTPPEPERELGEQFRRDFLFATATFLMAELLRLVFSHI